MTIEGWRDDHADVHTTGCDDHPPFGWKAPGFGGTGKAPSSSRF